MAYIIERPQINGLNEKEQLAQMRNYLFKQAEQLQFALNDLETGGSSVYATSQSPQSASAIFGAIKELIFNSFGDYVTEAGTVGGWTYKKWGKGTYEMHGRFDVTPTSSTKGTSLYTTNAILIPTPFPITGDAVITGMGEGDYWLTCGAYVDASTISIKLTGDKTISTTAASGVRLHVVGTYAINTEEENGD